MSLPVPADDAAPEPLLPPAESDDAAPTRPALRIRGPGEILQVVPYLLGFHPADSVVLIALRGRTVVVSARYDLDAPPEMAVPWMAAACKEGARSVLFVVYGDTEGPPLQHREHVDRLAELADHRGLSVTDRLVVADDRWWSYDCSNPACCPPEGTVIDRSGPAAVGAVTEGLVCLPRRADLEAELAPDLARMAEVAQALDAAGEDTPVDLRPEELRAHDWARVRTFVRDCPGRTGPIEADEAAAVLWALLDLHVRDATIGFLAQPPRPEVTAAWRELVQVAPPLWRAPVATLYAFWCYADGQGARTNVGIEVARAANPEYSLAALLDELVCAGVNPRRIIPDLAKDCRSIARRIERKRSPTRRPRTRRGRAGG